MNKIELLTPDWKMDVVDGDSVVHTTVHDVGGFLPNGQVDKGLRCSVAGRVDRKSYLYVLQIAADKSVAVLFPPNGDARQVDFGAELRLPETGRFTAPITGVVRVVESSSPVAAKDWPEYLKGREGQSDPSNIKNSTRQPGLNLNNVQTPPGNDRGQAQSTSAKSSAESQPNNPANRVP